jgi:hypothetical protein
MNCFAGRGQRQDHSNNNCRESSHRFRTQTRSPAYYGTTALAFTENAHNSASSPRYAGMRAPTVGHPNRRQGAARFACIATSTRHRSSLDCYQLLSLYPCTFFHYISATSTVGRLEWPVLEAFLGWIQLAFGCGTWLESSSRQS